MSPAYLSARHAFETNDFMMLSTTRYVCGLAFFSNMYYNALMLTTKKKQTIIKKYQMHPTDTGSQKLQVAMLTEQIDRLADHLKHHKKDNHSRRGLIKMVAHRRGHLKVLEKKNPTQHKEALKIIKE